MDLPQGSLVQVRLVGVVEAEQTDPERKTVRNDGLIARANLVHDLSELSIDGEFAQNAWEEIETFFVDYDRRDGKKFHPLARADESAALKLARDATSSEVYNGKISTQT